MCISFIKIEGMFVIDEIAVLVEKLNKNNFQVFAFHHQLLHKGHQPVGWRAKRRHSETCVAVSETSGWSHVAITKSCGLSIAMSFMSCELNHITSILEVDQDNLLQRRLIHSNRLQIL